MIPRYFIPYFVVIRMENLDCELVNTVHIFSLKVGLDLFELNKFLGGVIIGNNYVLFSTLYRFPPFNKDSY